MNVWETLPLTLKTFSCLDPDMDSSQPSGDLRGIESDGRREAFWSFCKPWGWRPPSNHLLTVKVRIEIEPGGSLVSLAHRFQAETMSQGLFKAHKICLLMQRKLTESWMLYFVGSSQLAAPTSWMACGHCEVARKTEMVRRSGGQMDKLLLLKKQLHHLTFFDTAVTVSFTFCLCIN